MPAKVIVVIQHEDLAVASVPVSKELRGRQSRDAASNHHKVVGRLCLFFGQPKRSSLTCQRVSNLIGAIDTAAHAGERGRVVVGAQ